MNTDFQFRDWKPLIIWDLCVHVWKNKSHARSKRTDKNVLLVLNMILQFISFILWRWNKLHALMLLQHSVCISDRVFTVPSPWWQIGQSRTLRFGCSTTHSAECQVLHAGSPPGCSILRPSMQHQNCPKATGLRQEQTHCFTVSTNKKQTAGVK